MPLADNENPLEEPNDLSWDDHILQLERSTKALGGPDGPMNRQAKTSRLSADSYLGFLHATTRKMACGLNHSWIRF